MINRTTAGITMNSRDRSRSRRRRRSALRRARFGTGPPSPSCRAGAGGASCVAVMSLAGAVLLADVLVERPELVAALALPGLHRLLERGDRLTAVPDVLEHVF